MTTYDLSVTETLTIKSTLAGSANGVFHVRVRESAPLSDSDIPENIKYGTMTEEMHAFALVSENTDGVFPMVVRDTLHATDTGTSHFIATHSITDTLTIRDSLGGGGSGSPFDGTWNLNVVETAHAVDAQVDPETFTTPGLYFWGYRYAYNAGHRTLAVWVAGLDCGDHAVNPDGSVFVPWQSDPDGLFTPTYLYMVSLSPPDGGFGASACNVEFTNNLAGITRCVVDVAIGLPYTSEVQMLRPNAPDLTHSQYGPSLAETRRVHQYGALLANAQGLSVGTTQANLRPVLFLDPDGNKYPSSQLFSGIHWELLDCDYDFDGMLLLQMVRPYPATVAALIGFMKTFDRE